MREKAARAKELAAKAEDHAKAKSEVKETTRRLSLADEKHASLQSDLLKLEQENKALRQSVEAGKKREASVEVALSHAELVSRGRWQG